MKQLEELKELLEKKGVGEINLPVNVEEMVFRLTDEGVEISVRLRGEEVTREVKIEGMKRLRVYEACRKQSGMTASIERWPWIAYTVLEPRKLKIDLIVGEPVIYIVR